MIVEQSNTMKQLFSKRDYLSHKVPPLHYMRKHNILAEYITEGTTKSGLTCYWERDVTVEQLQEQIRQLSNLLTVN